MTGGPPRLQLNRFGDAANLPCFDCDVVGAPGGFKTYGPREANGRLIGGPGRLSWFKSRTSWGDNVLKERIPQQMSTRTNMAAGHCWSSCKALC